MAGFSKVYFVGATGGFMGADGLAYPFFQIMVGDAGRQWLEAIYNFRSESGFAPAADVERPPPSLRMGRVTTIIPARPNDPVALMDAVIAFQPALFRGCPSLDAVQAQLANVEVMDFDAGENIPRQWAQLRAEALPRFRELAIFEADLELVETRGIPNSRETHQ